VDGKGTGHLDETEIVIERRAPDDDRVEMALHEEFSQREFVSVQVEIAFRGDVQLPQRFQRLKESGIVPAAFRQYYQCFTHLSQYPYTVGVGASMLKMDNGTVFERRSKGRANKLS
jgi:hypothetical protein